MKRNVLVRWLVVPLLCIPLIGQEPGGAASTAEATSDPLKAIKDQNTLVEEQIKLLTNQQKLAGMYFPAVPQRLEPSFQREGVATLRGALDAYTKLRRIANDIARDLKPGSAVGWQAVTEAEGCKDLKGGDLRRCKLSLDNFNQLASERTQGLKPAEEPPLARVFLQGQREKEDILEYHGILTQLAVIEAKLKAVLPSCGAAGALGGGVPVATLIGPALQATVDLVKFFRTKTSVASMSVDTDETAFLAMVAAAVRGAAGEVYVTGEYPPSLLDTADPSTSQLVKRIAAIRDQLKCLEAEVKKVDAAKAEADNKAVRPEALLVLDAEVSSLEGEIKHWERLHLAAAPAQQTDIEGTLKRLRTAKQAAEVKVAELEKPVKAAATLSKQLAAVLKQWTDLRDSVNGALASFDGGQAGEAWGGYLRTERLIATMKQSNTGVLQVKVHLAGAEATIKDRMGKASEIVHGGAIASYLLYDAAAGKILASNVFQYAPEK